MYAFSDCIMKWIFGPCVVWPFDKKLIFRLVTHIRTRDYTVYIISYLVHKNNSIPLMPQYSLYHYSNLQKQWHRFHDWKLCNDHWMVHSGQLVLGLLNILVQSEGRILVSNIVQIHPLICINQVCTQLTPARTHSISGLKS